MLAGEKKNDMQSGRKRASVILGDGNRNGGKRVISCVEKRKFFSFRKLGGGKEGKLLDQSWGEGGEAWSREERKQMPYSPRTSRKNENRRNHRGRMK